MKNLYLLFSLFIIYFASTTLKADLTPKDRTESPYFMVISKDNVSSKLQFPNIYNFNAMTINPPKAREPLYFGLTLGYSKNYQTADFNIIPNMPVVKGIYSSGEGFYIGLRYFYIFGDVMTSQSMFTSNLNYESLPINYGTIYQGILLKKTNNEIVSANANISSKISFLDLDLLYNYLPIKNFNLGLALGPIFSFPITSITKTEVILPINTSINDFSVVDNPIFKSNNTDVVIDGRSSMLFGMKFKLFLDMIFPRIFFITPEIEYTYYFNRFQSKMNWKISTLNIGCSITFGFNLKNDY
ncbi:MAG: hypothetical protein ABSG15_00640 [FCB group bacterium]|jgi:hypothetical protein